MIKSRSVRITLGAGLAACALAISTALAGTALAGTALAGTAGSVSGWRIAFSHHYGGPETTSVYLGVTSVGPQAGWAVGGTNALSGWPIAAHWNGRKWRSTPMPRGLGGYLEAVSADSAKDAWAVSGLNGYLLHWTGGRWVVAKRWPEHSLAQELTGVTAFSPHNVWAFGGSGAFPGLGTWHLQGTKWTKATGFGSNISVASAVSPTDIWGVGGINAGDDSIMQYTGGRWRHAVAKPLAGMQFHGIIALPGDQVWASANSQMTAFSSYLLHRDGGRWTALKVPWRVDPGTIATDGNGGIWLVGFTSAGAQYLIHRSAAGRWSRSLVGPSQGSVIGLNLIAGTSSLWGAGSVAGTAGPVSAIWAHGPVG